MKKYKKKTPKLVFSRLGIIVEAIQLTDESFEELCEFVGEKLSERTDSKKKTIVTEGLDGITCLKNGWIAQNERGELMAFSDNDFKILYEEYVEPKEEDEA